MRTVLWGFGGFLVGGALAFGIGAVLPSIITISTYEGSYGLGVVFVWTPLGAIVGAVVGVIVGLVRGR